MYSTHRSVYFVRFQTLLNSGYARGLCEISTMPAIERLGVNTANRYYSENNALAAQASTEVGYSIPQQLTLLDSNRVIAARKLIKSAASRAKF